MQAGAEPGGVGLDVYCGVGPAIEVDTAVTERIANRVDVACHVVAGVEVGGRSQQRTAGGDLGVDIAHTVLRVGTVQRAGQPDAALVEQDEVMTTTQRGERES